MDRAAAVLDYFKLVDEEAISDWLEVINDKFPGALLDQQHGREASGGGLLHQQHDQEASGKGVCGAQITQASPNPWLRRIPSAEASGGGLLQQQHLRRIPSAEGSESPEPRDKI